MSLTVYWASGSPYAWRVLLALEVKRLSYEAKLLEFSKGDLKTPEYLARNPRGRVPTLIDGDFTLYESIAILYYLDRKYPEPALFGRTPEEAGLVMRLVCEYQAYLDEHVENFILPLYFGKADEKADQLRASVAAISPELARLEERARSSIWLGGEAISAADLVIFPALRSLERAASKPAARALEVPFHPLVERHPALAAWVGRIEALPGYQRTYPPHWR
jgi:glutathione S-transferase